MVFLLVLTKKLRLWKEDTLAQRKRAISSMKKSEVLGDPAKNTVDDLYDMPLLYQAYPELSKTDLKVAEYFRDFTASIRGSYNPSTKTMQLNPRKMLTFGESSKRLSPTEVDDTMIHEIQHFIQEAEGHISGGNKDTVSLLDEGVLDKVRSSYISERAEMVNRLRENTKAGKTPRTSKFDVENISDDELIDSVILRTRIKASSMNIRKIDALKEQPEKLKELRELKIKHEAMEKQAEKYNRVLARLSRIRSKSADKFFESSGSFIRFGGPFKKEKDIAKQIYFKTRDKYSEVRDKVNKLNTELRETPSAEKIKVFNKENSEFASRAYSNIFGEIEARDAAARSFAKSDKYRDLDYLETQGIAEEDFIIPRVGFALGGLAEKIQKFAPGGLAEKAHGKFLGRPQKSFFKTAGEKIRSAQDIAEAVGYGVGKGVLHPEESLKYYEEEFGLSKKAAFVRDIPASIGYGVTHPMGALAAAKDYYSSDFELPEIPESDALGFIKDALYTVGYGATHPMEALKTAKDYFATHERTAQAKALGSDLLDTVKGVISDVKDPEKRSKFLQEQIKDPFINELHRLQDFVLDRDFIKEFAKGYAPDSYLANYKPKAKEPDKLFGKMINIGTDYTPSGLIGKGEGLLSFLSSGPATIAGGLAGLGSLLSFQGLDAAGENQKFMTDLFTYVPKTEKAQKSLDVYSSPFTFLGSLGTKAGDRVAEVTESPGLAAITATAVQAVPMTFPFLKGAAKSTNRAVKYSIPEALENYRKTGNIYDPVARSSRKSLLESELANLNKKSEGLSKKERIKKKSIEDELKYLNLMHKQKEAPKSLPLKLSALGAESVRQGVKNRYHTDRDAVEEIKKIEKSLGVEKINETNYAEMSEANLAEVRRVEKETREAELNSITSYKAGKGKIPSKLTGPMKGVSPEDADKTTKYRYFTAYGDDVRDYETEKEYKAASKELTNRIYEGLAETNKYTNPDGSIKSREVKNKVRFYNTPPKDAIDYREETHKNVKKLMDLANTEPEKLSDKWGIQTAMQANANQREAIRFANELSEDQKKAISDTYAGIGVQYEGVKGFGEALDAKKGYAESSAERRNRVNTYRQVEEDRKVDKKYKPKSDTLGNKYDYKEKPATNTAAQIYLDALAESKSLAESGDYKDKQKLNEHIHKLREYAENFKLHGRSPEDIALGRKLLQEHKSIYSPEFLSKERAAMEKKTGLVNWMAAYEADPESFTSLFSSGDNFEKSSLRKKLEKYIKRNLGHNILTPKQYLGAQSEDSLREKFTDRSQSNQELYLRKLAYQIAKFSGRNNDFFKSMENPNNGSRQVKHFGGVLSQTGTFFGQKGETVLPKGFGEGGMATADKITKSAPTVSSIGIDVSKITSAIEKAIESAISGSELKVEDKVMRVEDKELSINTDALEGAADQISSSLANAIANVSIAVDTSGAAQELASAAGTLSDAIASAVSNISVNVEGTVAGGPGTEEFDKMLDTVKSVSDRVIAINAANNELGDKIKMIETNNETTIISRVDGIVASAVSAQTAAMQQDINDIRNDVGQVSANQRQKDLYIDSRLEEVNYKLASTMNITGIGVG
jgi:hypothetical protein